MKIKTAFKTILSIVFIFAFSNVAFAQFNENVNVTTNINDDLYSQVSLSKSTIEVQELTDVNIHMLYSNGNPISGRALQIYIDGVSTGIQITQPSNSDYFGNATGKIKSSSTGTYTVCVRDITDIIPIYIADCETLFVVPLSVPVMAPEDQYTNGTKNSVSWNHTGSNTYQYQVQVSTTSNFSNVISTSAWSSSKTYEFKDLVNGQIYFYHARARNEYGGVSDWSGSVYSIQDSQQPTITILDLGDLEDNTIEEWDNAFLIPMKFRVKDNVGISNVSFFCVLEDGTLSDCTNEVVFSGDLLNVNLNISDLEKTEDYQLFEKYSFCVEASDTVGNIIRKCDIEITFPHQETPSEPGNPDVPVTPTKPTPPIVKKTKDDIDVLIDDIVNILDDTIGKLSGDQLDTVTVTTTATTLTVGLGALLASIGSLPYLMIEFGLSLLSFLGFRKKGQVSGYVYDSITKAPISQAIVRVFDINNSLIWTDVTNGNGYFATPDLEDDEYIIKVMARQYVFPSKIVFGKEDFPLENVYNGSMFYIKDGKFPNFSIPLDRISMKESVVVRQRVIASLKWLFTTFHLLLFFLGLVFSIYTLYTNQLWWNYLVVFLYIPSFILLVRNIFGENEKWGVVKDVNGVVQEGVVIGLKDVEYNRLVSKRVTNSSGKYRFVVEKGRYIISLLNPSLKLITEVKEIVVEDIDKEQNVIALDLVVEDVEKKKEKEILEKKLEKKRQEEKELLIPLEEL